MTILIKNATLVNEGQIKEVNLLIRNQMIVQISEEEIKIDQADEIIDASGLHLIPGMIDDQVHFREPGLTHKGEIATESKAALAGGITSFMEMPNTVPNALTQELLQDKFDIASESSFVNYSFFMGASNNNIEEVLKTNPKDVCGIKVFMGSSTGNMLVDKEEVLEALFSKCNMLIATHCEHEPTVRANIAAYKEKYGDDVPIECHPEIRSEEACYLSSSMAVELANKHDARLHILHISTEKELALFDQGPIENKRITAEACIHHMWFSEEDYKEKGTHIKWNPAVKKASDRDAILNAVKNDVIDIIATDHAPHTIEEKNNSYFKAPSGGPLVQHALVALFQLYHSGKISLEQIVEKTSHAPAKCFDIEKRGFVREGYFADLVLVNLKSPWTVTKENILYKCGWSPFEGTTFSSSIEHVIVNGKLAFSNNQVLSDKNGMRLTFDRN